MKTVKSKFVEPYQVFQITINNIIDNSDWPQWLKDAEAKGIGEINSIFYKNFDRSPCKKMILRSIVGHFVVNPEDWIAQDKNGNLFPIRNNDITIGFVEVSLGTNPAKEA